MRLMGLKCRGAEDCLLAYAEAKVTEWNISLAKMKEE